MIFLIIIAIVFSADYFVKERAENFLKDQTVREVAGDKILLRKHENRGFAFGLLRNRPKDVLLASASSVAAVATIFLGYFIKGGNFLQKLGTSLALGGGLNNLFDRYRKGSVTDYFSFNVKQEKIRKLVFNISDICIILGMVITVIGELINILSSLSNGKTKETKEPLQ